MIATKVNVQVNVYVMNNVPAMDNVLATAKAVCVTITQVGRLIVVANAQTIAQMNVELNVLVICVKTVLVMAMFVRVRINVSNLIIVLDTVLVMENVLVMR